MGFLLFAKRAEYHTACEIMKNEYYLRRALNKKLLTACNVRTLKDEKLYVGALFRSIANGLVDGGKSRQAFSFLKDIEPNT